MIIHILIVSIFNFCLVGNSDKTHLSISKVFQSNCLFVNLKPDPRQILQTEELYYYKPKTKHSFFDDNRQRVCVLLKKDT